MESDIKKAGEQWSIFEEFLNEYDAIEQEEWAIYRRKPYIFADFLSKWESQTASMITIPAMRSGSNRGGPKTSISPQKMIGRKMPR